MYLQKNNQAMEAHNFFWQAKEVEVCSKCVIYMAINFNLLL